MNHSRTTLLIYGPWSVPSHRIFYSGRKKSSSILKTWQLLMVMVWKQWICWPLDYDDLNSGWDLYRQGQVKSRFRAGRLTALTRLEMTRAISPDLTTGPIPVPAQGEACQGTVKACCNLDAKYQTERTSYLLLLFLLCWGYGWTRGREKDLCVWLLGPLLTFDSSNIHSLKDNDSPKDTRQPGPNLLNQTLEALTFLSLASNTFKSSSYALKSSGKHRLEAWMQFQRMEEKRIYREMGNSMGKNIPWVIKEEVEIPKGEESWRHWSL